MVAPYISRDDVGASLASLIHTTSRAESSGLEHLLLVDLLMTAPDMPAGDDSRRLVLRDLLVSEITSAVTDLRRMFNLDPPDSDAPLDEALRALNDNAATGSHELIAWSVLYYRYVRAELGLSVERLSEIVAVHTRTITRYTDDGIDLLTQRLIRAEQEARRQHLQRRLYALLPYSIPQRLVGREELLRSTEQALPSLSPPHLLITGASGIGKTAFVQELLRRQIDAGNLDHLVWLDHPGSADYVRQAVGAALLPGGSQVSLRDYLLLYRVAVVLDEIETAAADAEAFAVLLRDLGAALVCLISRNVLAVNGIEARLHLTEIAPSDGEALVRDALRLRVALTTDEQREIASGLYEFVGGNPLALRLAAGLWENADDWRSLEATVEDRLLARAFAALDDDSRRAWAGLVLFPHPARADMLAALWDIQPDAVASLVRLAVAEPGEAGGAMLVGGARAYARRDYVADGDFRALLDGLVAELEPGDQALGVIEQTLITGFPELDRARRGEWIGQEWAEGLRRGHWAHWRAILESHLSGDPSPDPDLRIAYGMCLRHFADWDGARQVFYTVAADCGRSGRFAEQSQALVEWSVLARNQGDYEQALSLIGQARRYAQRVRDDDLLRALARHEAQILIPAGRAADAYRLLVDLPESAQVLTLQSEVELALRHYDACRSLAARALKLMSGDPATEASLYTIVGRSYEDERQHDRAHGYLTDAVTLLERSDDPFALARAQTNLAAVLIPMRRFADAGTLLARAETVQARLGDRVGLSATRHNLVILGGHIAD